MMKTCQPIDSYAYRPDDTVADQRLTVDNTAGGVQFAAFGPKTTHVNWSLETAEVRYTLDGSAPTTTNGHALAAGAAGIWPISWIVAAKFIRTTDTSGVIHASPLRMSGS